jgi:class 3 adenylate cyclase
MVALRGRHGRGRYAGQPGWNRYDTGITTGSTKTLQNKPSPLGGYTVNTAKRMCDHAPGGQLLAGPLADVPTPTAVQSIQAKGKQQPVLAAVYAVDVG